MTFYVNSKVINLLHIQKYSELNGANIFNASKFTYVDLTMMLQMYTVLHMFRQVLFGAGNQGNHQNFEKSLLTNKL